MDAVQETHGPILPLQLAEELQNSYTLAYQGITMQMALGDRIVWYHPQSLFVFTGLWLCAYREHQQVAVTACIIDDQVWGITTSNPQTACQLLW